MFIEKSDKKLILNILSLFKPYKFKIILVTGCIILSSGLSILTPIINQHLMDEGLILKDTNLILRYSVYNLILMALIQILGMVETKYRAYIQNLLSYNLEKESFKHTLKLKMSFFNNTNYAEIISNLRTDINNISQIANQNTFYIITSILRILVGIIGLITIDYRLSLLVLVLTPLRYLIVKFLAKKRKGLISRYIESYRDYSKWYGDTIGGIKEIKIWGLEPLKIKDFINKQRKIISQNIRTSYLEKANSISETVFSEVISASIYIISGYLLVNGTLTVGKIFAFITYSAYVTQPIFALMNIGYSFASVIPSAKRYFSFMALEHESAVADTDSLVKINPDEISGSIEFKNINFSYGPDEKILKNINLKINSGEKVAIIGTNGSGKTTMINLILRFITPDSGSVLLDGIDINSIKLNEYRNLISVVSQEAYLFNTSIRENIVLNSNKSDIQMYSASKNSNASKFIDDLPEGYESVVGERGSKLSGGQRQKIAMARAFIHDSKILILDEATANYDMEAECYVNNVLEKNYKNQTVITISHKPDILSKVDKIIVVHNGEIQDIGNHLELYERNKFYRDMVSTPEISNM